MGKYLQAEKELAALLITTGELISINGQAHIKRPDGNAWRLTPLPRWTRDNAAAFALMVEHDIAVDPSGLHVVYAHVSPAIAEDACYSNHPDRETAVRYAIVQAVIAKLKIANKWLGEPNAKPPEVKKDRPPPESWYLPDPPG